MKAISARRDRQRAAPRRGRTVLGLTAACALLAACAEERPPREPPPADTAAAAGTVRPGIEVLLRDSLHLVAGRRVGLITNRSGVGRDGRSTIDLLGEAEGVELAALFSPEHGIRGELGEGVAIEDSTDARTGLPIHSLYGETLKPTPEMLLGLEALLFDIQDIGARYYTYVSTMTVAMETAAEAGLRFVVLDRPNPIGGSQVQGAVLQPAFASFVGLHPIPLRHGMTAGELARLYNQRYGIGADLHVVPAEGWRRDAWFDETGLPWVAPSPNIPSLESATHYPGTGLFEGTNLSVGRGTALPFQQIGAPWLDGETLADRLNGLGLPGIRFESTEFTPIAPTDGKYDGEPLTGVRFVATDRARYDPTVAAAAALIEARRLAADRWEWRPAAFDRLAGNGELREIVESGGPLERAVEGWREGAESFRRLREPYLIYSPRHRSSGVSRSRTSR